jgi:hypothetical protein
LLKPILSANPSSATRRNVQTPAAAQKRHADAEQKAIAAAEPWLALVDRGEYSQAWEAGSGVLKKQTGRRDFIKIVGDKRKPFGKVASRQLESKRFTTTLPGAPEGQYVVLQYRVAVANHKSAIETVVLVFGNEKKWRVSGYQFE